VGGALRLRAKLHFHHLRQQQQQQKMWVTL
jgi:hypothetical protein